MYKKVKNNVFKLLILSDQQSHTQRYSVVRDGKHEKQKIIPVEEKELVNVHMAF